MTRSKRDWTAARAKVDREGQCRVCGTSFQLEAAHIVPRSLGGRMSEDAIVPLCRLCHMDYDDLRLSLTEYLTHDEQAEAVRVLGLERARRRLSPEAA
jgi:heterodisulfide reductase subunit B